MAKIYLAFIGDGHGPKTPGKRSPYIEELKRQIRENEFNKPVVDFLEEDLKRHGIHVYQVAPGDEDVPLNQRTDYANKIYWQYCSKYGKENVVAIYISVHYNAFDGVFNSRDPEGFSVHVFTGHANKEAGRLGKSVLKHLAGGTKQVNRGLKENDFAVLRNTAMPAILSENGFMDNLAEAKRMLDVNYQKEVAREHTQGACEYFGIKYIEKASASKTVASGTYTIQKGDTFWGIEEKLELKHGTLEKLNPTVNPNNLKVGLAIKTGEESEVRYMFKTGWFREGTKGLYEMEKYLKDHGWDYVKVKEE
jgi:N-acetylmuramoyl-L-alanine amidase